MQTDYTAASQLLALIITNSSSHMITTPPAACIGLADLQICSSQHQNTYNEAQHGTANNHLAISMIDHIVASLPLPAAADVAFYACARSADFMVLYATYHLELVNVGI